VSRDKRAAARTVRKFLRLHGLSPEQAAAQYPTTLWGASGRTVRRWADGESLPHPSILTYLRENVALASEEPHRA
jgi:hypothetical protein